MSARVREERERVDVTMALSFYGIQRFDVGTPSLHKQFDAFVAGRDFGMKDLQALPKHLNNANVPGGRNINNKASGHVTKTRDFERSRVRERMRESVWNGG